MYNSSYFDTVETLLQTTCALENHYVTFTWAYNTQLDLIVACVYSSISEICFAIMYYLLRPEDPDDFEEWWSLGKINIIFMFICTGISAICLLCLFALLIGWYAIQEKNYCDPSFNFNRPAVGYGMLLFFFVVVVFISF